MVEAKPLKGFSVVDKPADGLVLVSYTRVSTKTEDVVPLPSNAPHEPLEVSNSFSTKAPFAEHDPRFEGLAYKNVVSSGIVDNYFGSVLYRPSQRSSKEGVANSKKDQEVFLLVVVF